MADPGEVTTELTATQYVILAENQRKKKALAEAKSAASKVTEENKLLLRQLEETQRENYEVTEHLRRELLAKSERIAALEADLVQLAEEKDEEATAQREALLAETSRVREGLEAKNRDLQGQLESLQAELASVADFRSRQAEVEDALVRLREENQGLTERLEAQRLELERYYLELNTRMRKEYEQRLEELKKSAEEEVDERLGAAVKRILGQNRRMAEELRIHVQETEVLQAEVRLLEGERQRLGREVGLKSELEQGYAQRGARQQATIRDLGARIAALENSLQKVLQDFESERQATGRAHAAVLADTRSETEALRRLVLLKSRELKNVRRLAQQVLLQRSDVEAFLLGSLHQVKREIERGSLRPNAPPVGSANADEQAASATAATNTANAGTANAGTGRMDLKELSWEDRERILRLLFAKINNQAQQAHFSNLPLHPLEQVLAAGTGTAGGLGGTGSIQGLATEAGPAAIV